MTLRGDDLTITDMVIPTSVDAADAAEFHAMINLGNRMAEIDAGIDDLSDTAEEILPSWLEQTDRSRLGFIARRDGSVVGAAELTTSNAGSTSAADIGLMVLPPEMADGVGQALLDRLIRATHSLERSVLQTWSLHPPTRGKNVLTPATGWGSVTSTPLSDVLLANGFALEQVERNSVLSFDGPLNDVERRLVEASTFAGPSYRVESWTLPTPAHLRVGYGNMIARMATDVPSGGLVTEGEVWDEARVIRRDTKFAAGGQTVSVAAVIDTASGEMVAFNELVIGSDPAGITHQWGTLVAKEHRGKRLGTVVKCANLLRWQQIAPDSPKVSTFNAEENRPMLSINEAIGFVPISYAAGWQKRLD